MLKNNRFGISKLLKSKFLVFLLIAAFGCINLKFIEGAEAITLNSNNCLAHVHQTGLLLHLDAGSPCQTGSASNWLDTSGNSKDLSLVNSPSFTSAAQKTYNFNGTNQYGTLPSGFSDFSSGISITFFANWTSESGSWDRIIDLAYSASGSASAPASDNILLSRSSTGRNIVLEFYNGGVTQGSCVTNSNNAITANTWKHYAVIISPTGDKCRNDGMAKLQKYFLLYMPCFN